MFRSGFFCISSTQVYISLYLAWIRSESSSRFALTVPSSCAGWVRTIAPKPLTPPHLAHWMGATEIVSDAVLGRAADAFDIDSRATMDLWLAVVETGSRVAASGSTDAALGRERTRSPGDRRVYARAERFDYESIVDALRLGRTVATNGGPLFPILRVNGGEPGADVEGIGTDDSGIRVTGEVRSLHPLRVAEVFVNGERLRAVDLREASGTTLIDVSAPLPEGGARVVVRVEDARGHWAVASPVYVGTPGSSAPSDASAVVFAIHNATRFIELRKQFFAHAIVTVSKEQAIERVELVRDGRAVTTWRPTETEAPSENAPGARRRTAVTEIRGDYEAGSTWHREGSRVVHGQFDAPVDSAGWYQVMALASDGSRVSSDRLWFDPEYENSHAISTVRLSAPRTKLRWLGYGEEMPLEEITTPFEGDHWWYPRRGAWRLEATFGEETRRHGGGDDRTWRLFRPPGDSRVTVPTKRVDLLRSEHAPLGRFVSWLRASRHRDPKRVFRLEKGVLRISGDGFGYLGTRRAYRDYRLVLEYRWGGRNFGSRVGKARDAGLFLHASGPHGNSHDGDGAFRAAIECQIMEGATGDLMLIRGDDAEGRLIPMELSARVEKSRDADGWPRWDPDGSDTTRIERWGRLNFRGKDPAWRDEFRFRGRDDAESPVGEWTRLDVTASSDTIEVRVNGQLVNRATSVRPNVGEILLQCEGSELFVRRFELAPLEE